jgi:hypothetical protein
MLTSLATHHPTRPPANNQQPTYNHRYYTCYYLSTATMAETTASINKPKDSKGSNGHYLTVFYNVRGKTAKVAQQRWTERADTCRLQARPCWKRAGTTCLQCRNSGAWYDNTVDFSKALLQNINNNQPGGTWGFAKMEVYQTT